MELDFGSGSGGFNAALREKYRILGQEADSGTTQANASMMQARTQGMIAPSTIQSNLAGAELNRQQAAQVAPNAASARNLAEGELAQIKAGLESMGLVGLLQGGMLAGVPATQIPSIYADAKRKGQIRSAPELTLEPVIGTMTPTTSGLFGQGAVPNSRRVPGYGMGTE